MEVKQELFDEILTLGFNFSNFSNLLNSYILERKIEVPQDSLAVSKKELESRLYLCHSYISDLIDLKLLVKTTINRLKVTMQELESKTEVRYRAMLASGDYTDQIPTKSDRKKILKLKVRSSFGLDEFQARLQALKTISSVLEDFRKHNVSAKGTLLYQLRTRNSTESKVLPEGGDSNEVLDKVDDELTEIFKISTN